MSVKQENFEEIGLQFFGKMSASISHEMKNVFAVINENAGLLKDYTLMAEKGTPLDVERLKTLAEKIMGQIKRADGITKDLNRLAHSVDEPRERIDLGETLEFVVALCSRFAAMSRVSVKLASAENGLTITTAPFYLNNLIWRCLEFAIENAGEGKMVSVDIEKTGTGARVTFRQLGGLAGSHENIFPTKKDEHLLGKLKARVHVEAQAEAFSVDLPVE